MPHICVSESGQQWFTQWLVAYSAPSHYLNQCWVIVNWTLRNKLQWNFNQTTKFFIHVNASENVVCEMAAILSRGWWVNWPKQGRVKIAKATLVGETIYHSTCTYLEYWRCRTSCSHSTTCRSNENNNEQRLSLITGYNQWAMLPMSPQSFTLTFSKALQKLFVSTICKPRPYSVSCW